MEHDSPRRLAQRSVALPDGSVPDGTRGRILEAALEHFAERGFHGTSIRTIGAAAGITSATLYSHYASKEEILRDLVMIGITELRARITLAIEPATTSTDRLATLVFTHVEAHASFALLALVTNTELHALSPELAAPAIAIRRELQDMLEGILSEGVADGSFALNDVRTAAHAIAGMGLHVATWFTADDTDAAERLAAQFAEFGLRIAGAS
jgi:AcrR family transcriptional regulator